MATAATPLCRQPSPVSTARTRSTAASPATGVTENVYVRAPPAPIGSTACAAGSAVQPAGTSTASRPAGSGRPSADTVTDASNGVAAVTCAGARTDTDASERTTYRCPRSAVNVIRSPARRWGTLRPEAASASS